jgi:hypothetical protein
VPRYFPPYGEKSNSRYTSQLMVKEDLDPFDRADRKEMTEPLLHVLEALNEIPEANHRMGELILDELKDKNFNKYNMVLLSQKRGISLSDVAKIAEAQTRFVTETKTHVHRLNKKTLKTTEFDRVDKKGRIDQIMYVSLFIYGIKTIVYIYSNYRIYLFIYLFIYLRRTFPNYVCNAESEEQS